MENFTNDSSHQEGLLPCFNGNESLNITAYDVYAAHAPLIGIFDKYVTPIWFFVGFVGNILAFFVWVQPCMRSSSGTYLAALALDDLVFLIMKLITDLQITWGFPILNGNIRCQGLIIIFMTSQYLDPLLVLGFTVERYISICHPFKREKFCTTQRAVKVIMALTIGVLLLHAMQGYFWTINDEGQCVVRASVMGDLWTIWTWVTELLVFGVVPLAILVLNILVVVEIKKISRVEKRVSSAMSQKTNPSSATTFMLLVVSTYFIITTLPVTVCYSIVQGFPDGDWCLTYEEKAVSAVWQRHFTYWTVRKVIENICMSHYALTMYIYLLTGKVFRKKFTHLYECHSFHSRGEKCHNSGVNTAYISVRNGDVHDI